MIIYLKSIIDLLYLLKVDIINRGWDKLLASLGEREAGLRDMFELTTRNYDALQALTEWTTKATEKLETMPSSGSDPDTIQEQKSQLQVCLNGYILQIDTNIKTKML